MQAPEPEPEEKTRPPAPRGRGVEVSAGRADPLDTLGLRFIRKYARAGESVKVVDLGGGTGGHSVRMAAAGAEVWMADLSDAARAVFEAAAGNGTVPPGRLHFLHGDFADLAEMDVPDNFSMLYSQRALHYLPYAGARSLLQKMSARMAKKGRVYLSVAGVDSPFAENYPHRDRPMEERFSPLAPEMRVKYHLHLPIAVYDDKGLRRLLESSGFTGVKTRLSEAGGWNLQAVARKA
jgi:hypothetical protein